MKKVFISIFLAFFAAFTCLSSTGCSNQNGLFVVSNIQYEQPEKLSYIPEQPNDGTIIIGGGDFYYGRFKFDIVGRGDEAAVFVVNVQCGIYCNNKLQDAYAYSYTMHGNESITVEGEGGYKLNKNDKLTVKILKITWV